MDKHGGLDALLKPALRRCGVSMKRMPRLIKEIKRKVFHSYGLVIPVGYIVGATHFGLTGVAASRGLAVLLMIALAWEFARIQLGPWRGVGKELLRPSEEGRLSGMPFYLAGSALALACFPDRLAVAAVLFLILGDAAAACVGISFGRIRLGDKSLEGSLACFACCFLVAIPVLWSAPFVEILAFYGALAATLTELLSGHWVWVLSPPIDADGAGNTSLAVDLEAPSSSSSASRNFHGHHTAPNSLFGCWKRFIDSGVVLRIDDNFAIPVVSAAVMQLLAWRLRIQDQQLSIAQLS